MALIFLTIFKFFFSSTQFLNIHEFGTLSKFNKQFPRGKKFFFKNPKWLLESRIGTFRQNYYGKKYFFKKWNVLKCSEKLGFLQKLEHVKNLRKSIALFLVTKSCPPALNGRLYYFVLLIYGKHEPSRSILFFLYEGNVIDPLVPIGKKKKKKI